ncbi:MAG: heme ABC transporter permease [Leptothrix sp. (in: Bacteria)]|nr:heme ABC transporter permease [Leptothrix sp. (in: b-proteobacteria)]
MIRIWRYASPAVFHPLAGRMWPVFAIAALVFCLIGLGIAFFAAPTDAQQGEVYRIMFLHVPAAWMSMFIYFIMAVYAGLGFVLRTRLSSLMAKALAPTGLLYGVIALVSGAVWGKPTWGTWWAWDARLTSQVVLLCLYLGFIALRGAFDDPERGERASALLAIVGVVNLPVIYFSVVWWNTLHQGASLSVSGGVRMAPVMLAGLLAMTLACWCHAIAVSLVRAMALMEECEAGRTWMHPNRTARAGVSQRIQTS